MNEKRTVIVTSLELREGIILVQYLLPSTLIFDSIMMSSMSVKEGATKAGEKEKHAADLRLFPFIEPLLLKSEVTTSSVAHHICDFMRLY
jgi:hypothetical protein